MVINSINPMPQNYLDTVWCIAIANSCCFSYLYALTNRDFRDAFNKLFYYCCCKSHVTFSRKSAIVRRPIANESMNLRVHIIPGLNIYSPRKETTTAHHSNNRAGGGGGGGHGGSGNFGHSMSISHNKPYELWVHILRFQIGWKLILFYFWLNFWWFKIFMIFYFDYYWVIISNYIFGFKSYLNIERI